MRARTRSLALLVALAALSSACTEEELLVEPEVAAHYVEDVTCSACHEEAWREWSGSHHDLALQPATEETVLADFDDTRFEQAGVTTRFFRRDGHFMVATSGSADVDPVDVNPVDPEAAGIERSLGWTAEYEVLYVVGAESLQQYLIEFSGGRLQCLTVAWDTQRGAWFSLHPGEAFGPDDPRRWTGRYQRWNASCAACHSTALVKGYDAASDTYATSWAEPDVGCQACHGPGSNHLTWSTSYDQTLDPTRGLDLQLRHGAARTQLDVCAACHALRQPLLEVPPPGTEFLDAFAPELLHADVYFPDGQARGEAYVYGSFVQSRMHATGVGCTDCHAPHSLELVLEGNALCTQCHSLFAPNDQFPTLRVKNYDSPRHHFHERDTPGAACVACHMPERAQLIVDGRRDHSFRVPRPDLTVELGVPNACDDCHAEQGAAWAAARIEEWHGSERTARPHFASVLARARADNGDDEQLDAALCTLAADNSQAPIVRATALDLLREAGPQAAEVLRVALDDPDPLVRSAAARGFELLPLDRRQALLALLVDPVRVVRIAAAQTLVAYPRVELELDQVTALEAAMVEFRAAQELSLDLPETHATLGRYHARTGDRRHATEAWQRALEQDPWFTSARLELADLWFEGDDSAQAERLLREGLALQPDEGALHHSLGLLLSAAQRDDEAADALETAARLMPDEARVQYDAGLALATAGRDEDAERLLMDAALLAPRDPLPRHALVLFHLRRGQEERALEHARVLAPLVPSSPQAELLLEQLREAAQQ